MPQDNIADPSKPSPGRVYDYLLGGNHNFEVDRQSAEQVLKIMPFAGKFSRLQRWALQDIAVELSERRGYDVIIDFASGLPTMDNVHYKVQKGTMVIYSDSDPVVVEYARDILKDTSDVYFFQADARHPEELLSRPEVEKILAGRRKVGLVYWGISVFLSDNDIAHAARYLYDWAAPGSCFAFNAQGADVNPEDPALKQGMEIYKRMGQDTFPRSLKEYQELLKPWQPDAQGFIPLLEWHGFEQSELGKEDVAAYGPMGGGYGAYLIK
ncbi:MAG: SAM-dependent methyltransferase [Anaerolineales bacterium]|nr:SAM-dependent methyltransferase [Anaerolineales bacterium]